MIEVWVLHICFGISWGGCGGIRAYEYKDEVACYKALETMRVDVGDVKASEKRRSMWAICRPVERSENPDPGEQK
jgi:hypothetical protein